MFRYRVPLNIKQRLFRWFGLHMSWVRIVKYFICRICRINDSSHRVACGFAFGSAVSFTPFIGFHFVLAALLTWLARGNIMASLVGTVVGNPVTFPFIWFSIYNLGAWFLSFFDVFVEMGFSDMSVGNGSDFSSIWLLDGFWSQIFLPMIIGSIPLVIFSWLVAYYLICWAMYIIHKKWPRLRNRQINNNSSFEK